MALWNISINSLNSCLPKIYWSSRRAHRPAMCGYLISQRLSLRHILFFFLFVLQLSALASFHFIGSRFPQVFLFKGVSRFCLNLRASFPCRHCFKWVILHVEFSCCRLLPFSKASPRSTNGFQSLDTARLHSLCFFWVEKQKKKKKAQSLGKVQHQQTGILFSFLFLKCLLFICHYKIPSRSINSTLGRNYNTKFV